MRLILSTLAVAVATMTQSSPTQAQEVDTTEDYVSCEDFFPKSFDLAGSPTNMACSPGELREIFSDSLMDLSLKDTIYLGDGVFCNKFGEPFMFGHSDQQHSTLWIFFTSTPIQKFQGPENFKLAYQHIEGEVGSFIKQTGQTCPGAAIS